MTIQKKYERVEELLAAIADASDNDGRSQAFNKLVVFTAELSHEEKNEIRYRLEKRAREEAKKLVDKVVEEVHHVIKEGGLCQRIANC